ncbi:MAG: nitroreductase family protein [Cryomorphaceae bacterium]|jgi:nitroreductase|nr:nitroreductase family protein [Cryomorphaceae bacterium]
MKFLPLLSHEIGIEVKLICYYGMITSIDDLKWRYAVDKFDTQKEIDPNKIDQLCDTMRLAPSPYGLQPIKLLLITNRELRKELVTYSYNQQQVYDCSHLFIICTYNVLPFDYELIPLTQNKSFSYATNKL